MTVGWDAVTGVEWSRLFHAYGSAADTPGHLRALTSADGDARDAAIGHLWSAVIHQGTAWSATPPAALVVAGLLSDPAPARVGAGSTGIAAGTEDEPMRATLLDFLAEVAAAGRPDVTDDELERLAYPPGKGPRITAVLDAILTYEADQDEDDEDEDDEDEDDEDDEDDVGNPWESEEIEAIMNRVVVEIRAVAPVLIEAAVSCLSNADGRVRVSAAHAISALAALPALAGRRGALIAQLEATVHLATHRDERAVLLLAMGEMGAAPQTFLSDPDPAVRACAALAPALAGDDSATSEILAALADPEKADDWFERRPPQFRGHVRFTLMAAAMARVSRFEDLLPAAVAMAGITSAYNADSDWGPLLMAAFPDPGDPPEPPRRLTGAQRDYLRALVANERVWGTRIANARWACERVGLPYDRDACSRLIG